MRSTLFRWVYLLLILLVLVGFPIYAAHATQGVIQIDDPYPTVDVVAQVSDHTEVSMGLILGAGLIVVVIFVGVIFRRVKS